MLHLFMIIYQGRSNENACECFLGWPNGLALDYDEGKIYWGDAKTDKIEVCFLLFLFKTTFIRVFELMVI